MALCDIKESFLFQVRPDLFPEGLLSTVEMVLWGWYYEDKADRIEAARG